MQHAHVDTGNLQKRGNSRVIHGSDSGKLMSNNSFDTPPINIMPYLTRRFVDYRFGFGVGKVRDANSIIRSFNGYSVKASGKTLRKFL